MQQVLNGAPEGMTYSLVVPVYRNEENIDALLEAIGSLAEQLGPLFEAIFVVDGSPDRSFAMLRDRLPGMSFRSQLIALSRNFGAFPAIRVGLESSRGRYIAVMSADLQEPPDLVLTFFRELEKNEHDVAFGIRNARDDPWLSTLFSRIFWWTYRRFVIPDIPKGGVDIFAVQAHFRDDLLRLEEANSSLLAQLFWLGGRRLNVAYSRRRREHGRSAWTFRKKFRYLSDSIFSFTDLPVRALTILGASGLVLAMTFGAFILAAKVSGLIEVPGYAGTLLTVLFFGALNTFGIGIVGTYAWRAFENTKHRPLAIVQSRSYH